MKILWLHQYFATPRGWGAVRTYEFARRFCTKGHAVDVFCGSGYDTSLTHEGPQPTAVAGVRVFVGGTPYRPHMGFVRRVWSFLIFMAEGLWFVVRHGRRYDVLIASSGPLTLAVPALFAKWLLGTPYVFEVIDVWPDSAIAAGVLKNPALKWLSFKLEALAYTQASGIVTCSTGMTERVQKKLDVRSGEPGAVARKHGGRRTENGKFANDRLTEVVTISNCCDLDLFVADGEKRQRTRRRLGVRDDQTVALYTGAMGLSNAVEDLIAAVKETSGNEQIIWWFAGDGPCAEDIRKVVASCAQHRFHGTLPKEDLVELYLAADVNVITFLHEPLFYENSPNKFFDGIAAGLPAVFNRTTWLGPWLEQYGCGIVCKSENVGVEIARALNGLAVDGERRRQMGQGARRLAEEVFNRDKLAMEYLEVLEEVAR